MNDERPLPAPAPDPAHPAPQAPGTAAAAPAMAQPAPTSAAADTPAPSPLSQAAPLRPAPRQHSSPDPGSAIAADLPAATHLTTSQGERAPAPPSPPGGPASPPQPGFLEILLKGLWKENPGLCQLLGLCPLLAVTNSAVNALGLGAATLLVMIGSSCLISLLRRIIYRAVRIPLYIVLIATLVSLISMLTEAYFPALFESLGIYLALIVTNCIVMGRAEAFAGRHDVLRSAWDALAQGLGFALVLFTIGSLREIVGAGTWFAGAAGLLGEASADLEMHISPDAYTLLIAILPPGGFFTLGLLIALKNHLDGLRRTRQARRYHIRSVNI